jgi:O-antigen ligase
VTAISVQPKVGGAALDFRAAAAKRRRWPWVTAILIVIGFFMAVHELNASQEWQENAQKDVQQLVQNEESGRPIRQAGVLLLGAVGFVLLVRKTEHPWRINALVLLPLVMLILWAVLSASWSPDPAISFKRVVALLCGVMLAAGLVRQYEMETIAEMALLNGVVVALVGVVVELVLSRTYATNEEYRFAGTIHPNHQGAYAAVMLLSSMYLGWVKHDRRFWFFALFAIAVLFATKSRTALAAVIAGAVVFIALVWKPRQKVTIFLVAFCVVTTTIMLDIAGAFSNLEQTVLLDRQNADPTTLTGRTVIWEFAFDKIRDDSTRMLTGFGFGGFWTKDMVAELDSRAHFKLAEGHNAFLDLLLECGVVGLFFYLWALFASSVALFSRAKTQKSVAAAFGVSILMFAVVHHVAESGLLDVTFPSLMVWTAMGIAALRAPAADKIGWRPR